MSRLQGHAPRLLFANLPRSIKPFMVSLHTILPTCASRCLPSTPEPYIRLWSTPDGDSDQHHVKTSSSPGLPRSSALDHSPSPLRLSGIDCRNTSAPSSRLTVSKSRWSLPPHYWPLVTDFFVLWHVITLGVDARPCNDFGCVAARYRNCLSLRISDVSLLLFVAKMHHRMHQIAC